MMLKRKVDNGFSAVEKIFFDMLFLENIISDIEPNVSKKQEKIWCKLVMYEIICNTIITSKLPYFSAAYCFHLYKAVKGLSDNRS